MAMMGAGYDPRRTMGRPTLPPSFGGGGPAMTSPPPATGMGTMPRPSGTMPGTGRGPMGGAPMPPPGGEAVIGTPGMPGPQLPPSFGGGRGPGTTLGALDQQFGAGGLFDPTASSFADIEKYGREAAQRTLDPNLAAIRARYGASGFGNSGREALAEGEAVGNVATNLGSALANMREGSRQSDLGRAMQGLLGAGQIDLSRQQFQQQLPLQALQMLSQLGTGLLATGQSEQVPAFLQALMPFLTGFGTSSTFGKGRTG